MKCHSKLFAVAAALVVLSSCSKEKRLEHQVYKNDGQWNATSITYTQVNTDENNVAITVSATAENAGTFTFDKDGSGSYNLTVNGVLHPQDFSWGASDESIAITKVSQNIDFLTGNVEQLVIAFSGEKITKTKLLLTGSETIQATTDTGVTQEVLTATITLEK